MYHDDDDVAQRQIACYVVGLLIGGLLVWAFSGPVEPQIKPEEQTFNKQAFDACLSAGGVPILDRYHNLTECQSVTNN